MNTKLIWAFRGSLLLVLAYGASFWFQGERFTGARLLYWLLLAFPWLLSLAMPARRFNIATGLVIGVSVVLIQFLVLLSVLNSSKVIFLLCLVAGVGLFALLASIKASGHRGATMLALLLAVGYEAGLMESGNKILNYRTNVDADPISATYAIQGCVTRHQQSQGSFPGSLEELVRSDKCLEPILLKNLNVNYKPRNGARFGYTLSVEFDSFWNGEGLRLTTDEQGVVEESNQVAKTPYPLPNVAQVIYDLAQCTRRFQKVHGKLPGSLDESPYVSLCGSLSGKEPYFSQRGHLIAYTPVTDSFELKAIPREYAKTGVRSYLLDSLGKIHVTMENRQATADDPLAPDCEHLRYTKCR